MNDEIKPDQAAILFNPDGTVRTLLPKCEDEDAEVPYPYLVAAAVGQAIATNDPRIMEIMQDFYASLND